MVAELTVLEKIMSALASEAEISSDLSIMGRSETGGTDGACEMERGDERRNPDSL